jgi:hypothetical protein
MEKYLLLLMVGINSFFPSWFQKAEKWAHRTWEKVEKEVSHPYEWLWNKGYTKEVGFLMDDFDNQAKSLVEHLEILSKKFEGTIYKHKSYKKIEKNEKLVDETKKYYKDIMNIYDTFLTRINEFSKQKQDIKDKIKSDLESENKANDPKNKKYTLESLHKIIDEKTEKIEEIKKRIESIIIKINNQNRIFFMENHTFI